MTKLDEILAATGIRLERLRCNHDVADLERRAREAGPARPFAEALRADGVTVIGEIKRRSPSAGEIAPGIDAASLARAYEKGGAGALSVLTEPDFFDGALRDLVAAREATSLPVLRKDFILDRVQILEARAHGSDAVLLIARICAANLSHLVAESRAYGLDALVEVFDERDVEHALAAGADLVGVNNRDLTDFTVDLERTEKLAPLLPAGVTLVALSGVESRADVERLRAAGARAVLVGTAAARAGDPAAFIGDLLR